MVPDFWLVYACMKECELIKGGHAFGLLAVILIWNTEQNVGHDLLFSGGVWSSLWCHLELNFVIWLSCFGGFKCYFAASLILCMLILLLHPLYILPQEKFVQFDQLRVVVFQLNFKYLHVKIKPFVGSSINKIIIAWFVHGIWHKYHLWYFKSVSNFTRLTAHEVTYNNFEISLMFINLTYMVVLLRHTIVVTWISFLFHS